MSSLNKLAIRGIRSFDDKQISVIEFFSPVTVIVGHNGSGKTTIIECLKYATTGEQPAGTRGGAFVHDPKMANEKEVKAQVKLRFFAANGTRMLVVRNLSVTVKKAGLTMKTLESILGLADNEGNNGKRAVISTKCAEMDTEIPQLLGVSKAVLENVIFCHQEDSYWPLSEPSVLKKKFDEIFEATRYTKALDSIKVLRKERMSELNAEKERLVGLSREKAHADKLKNRISELKSTIAAKEVEYEQVKNQHDSLAEANRKFYEYSSKFREIYVKVGSLEEKEQRLRNDREEAMLNLQAIPGTDEELESRRRHFDDHINSQKQKKRLEDTRKQDLEDELGSAREGHKELLARQGALTAEAEAQNRRIVEREQLIHEISEKYDIKGFSHSPLERDKVMEFITRLGDAQRKQRAELERLQSELRVKTDEYNRKLRQLDSELESHRLQKSTLRDQIAERQSSITDGERRLDEQQTLQADLRSLQADIQEKRNRVEKIKNDISSSNYDARLNEKTERSRALEDKREQLNSEMRNLTMHADAGIKLDLKRGEIKTRTTEIQNILDIADAKFKKLAGKHLTAENMEHDIDSHIITKEQEQNKVEHLAVTTSSDLRKVEATLTDLKLQVRRKQEDVKKAEGSMKQEIKEYSSLEEGIGVATDEVNFRKEKVGNTKGASQIYESILRLGKEKHVCKACNRRLEIDELDEFEKYLKGLIQEYKEDQSSEESDSSEKLLKEWEEELERLQELRHKQALLNQIRAKDIPDLEEQIREQEEMLPQLGRDAEEAQGRLEKIKKEMRDVQTLKQQATTVARMQREIDRAKQEIASLEIDLASVGSTRSIEDVHTELEDVSTNLRTNERERQHLMQERDRQLGALRAQENVLHQMELNERDMTTKLREMTKLEEQIVAYKKDITTFTGRLKNVESKFTEAQAPINALEQEFKVLESELNARTLQAQSLSQELNMVVDKLGQVNKGVERYIKERRARELESCNEMIEQTDATIQDLSERIEDVRTSIAKIDKEISESGSTIANLRENLRVRRIEKEIKKTQEEIASYDMEEAAKAKRNFESRWDVVKKKEDELKAAYSHMDGAIVSLKSQLQSLESDFKEFKDVNKKYTDQLIRVKMSDMANNDLEKYAKALDNAIMKYHTLKMEEVNDTMKHLWNKTYQGTDIDGIKIRSDIEGGASKRSYNYRVVMVKDQVEMDMRGRCSAGQKMLASIIIRLALSDSFSQNCGILALDEPTNALDIENIDALAASLIDIINERKNNSNFQLVIITHDENFLRKLGQADVMEHYWRVSRDARQKSLIERERFR
ncbi:hypothetical protein AX15_002678 [Amanita polypyramis BW_CC]|nr:hypothetical protein AX15_002678 [Amanita polypyramis BW_CC]